jgi:DNA repair protein RadC
MTTLYVREGAEFREAEPADILTRAHALISQRYRSGSPVLSGPRRTEEFLRLHLGGRDYEVFGLLHLNTRHRLIAAKISSAGPSMGCLSIRARSFSR